MSEGFLMLRRTTEAFELLRDTNAFVLLTVIALRAQRTGAFNIHGLQSGQALLGDHDRYGMSLQQYRSAKARLQRWGFARFQSTSRGTVATLLDTRVYDIHETPAQPADDNPATPSPQSANEPATTTKNEKNENKEKKYPDDSDKGKKYCDGSDELKKYPDNSDELRLSQLLLDLIRRRKPDLRPPDLDRWAQGVAGMIRRDGRRPERIEAVIRWCQQDQFWKNNILNTHSLRRHFDRLELQMTPHSPSESTRDMVERMEREGKL